MLELEKKIENKGDEGYLCSKSTTRESIPSTPNLTICRSEAASLEGERRNEIVQQFSRIKDQLIGSLIDLKLYDQVNIYIDI